MALREKQIKIRYKSREQAIEIKPGGNITVLATKFHKMTGQLVGQPEGLRYQSHGQRPWY